MKSARLFHSVVGGFLVLAMCSPSFGGTFTLADGNLEASIDTTVLGEPTGMSDFLVNGTDQLAEQWYWFRIGSGPEASVSTLPVDFEQVIDTDFSGENETFFVRYLGDGFKIEIRYILQGEAPGSNEAGISEQIGIYNTGDTALDFHFFQYTNFDLGGTSGGDTVEFTDDNVVEQLEDAIRIETAVTPDPTHHEAAIVPAIRTSLEDGVATTLADTDNAGPGDGAWAFQWDFSLNPGKAYLISEIKTVTVPEPGTIGLLLLGGLAAVRRKRR